jgi:hypothetical protein
MGTCQRGRRGSFERSPSLSGSIDAELGGEIIIGFEGNGNPRLDKGRFPRTGTGGNLMIAKARTMCLMNRGIRRRTTRDGGADHKRRGSDLKLAGG